MSSPLTEGNIISIRWTDSKNWMKATGLIWLALVNHFASKPHQIRRLLLHLDWNTSHSSSSQSSLQLPLCLDKHIWPGLKPKNRRLYKRSHRRLVTPNHDLRYCCFGQEKNKIKQFISLHIATGSMSSYESNDQSREGISAWRFQLGLIRVMNRNILTKPNTLLEHLVSQIRLRCVWRY